MRTVTLLTLLVSATVTEAGLAQDRWVPIGDSANSALAVDLASFRQVDSALQVDVRSSSGPQLYDIVRYQVHCGTLALRAVSRAQYLADMNRPWTDSTGTAMVQEFDEDWFIFAPGSEGRLLTEAICRLGRDHGWLG